MELSPFYETTITVAALEFPKILWNSKVHYLGHKSSSLAPILSQIDPVHITPSYL
jgi:hypothetical protein